MSRDSSDSNPPRMYNRVGPVFTGSRGVGLGGRYPATTHDRSDPRLLSSHRTEHRSFMSAPLWQDLVADLRQYLVHCWVYDEPTTFSAALRAISQAREGRAELAISRSLSIGSLTSWFRSSSPYGGRRSVLEPTRLRRLELDRSAARRAGAARRIGALPRGFAGPCRAAAVSKRIHTCGAWSEFATLGRDASRHPE